MHVIIGTVLLFGVFTLITLVQEAKGELNHQRNRRNNSNEPLQVDLLLQDLERQNKAYNKELYGHEEPLKYLYDKNNK